MGEGEGRVGMLSAGVNKVREEILTHFLFLLSGCQTSSEEFTPPSPSILIIGDIRRFHTAADAGC